MKSLDKPKKSVADILEVLKADGASAYSILDINSALKVLVAREAIYEQKVPDNTLFEIPRDQIISSRVDKKKMVRFYEYRLLKKNKGREIYDEIIMSSPSNICPYCTIKLVKTIDHFLPKSQYPSYSISPINLVPCCRDCNTDKKIDFPTSSNDQTFHPYFDDVENDIWIKAVLMRTEPLSFQFKVIKPNGWSQIQYNRANAHFTSYGLNQLFSNEANRELTGSNIQMKNLYKRSELELKLHIEEVYNSFSKSMGVLYWKTLMYYELLNNNWFLNGCNGNSYFS